MMKNTFFVVLIIGIAAVALIAATNKSEDQYLTRGEAMSMMAPVGTFGTSNRNEFYSWEEFFNIGNSTTSGNSIYTRAFSGTGADAGASVVPVSGQSWGTAAMTTGTTATGYAYVRTNAALYFGQGDTWDVEIGLDSILALANATNAYSLRVGFHDGFASNDVTDGVFFLYDSLGVSTGGTASDKWQCVTAAGGTRSFYETASEVKMTPTTLRIVVMPASGGGDSAIFMINGDVVRSQTTNIPDRSSMATGFGIHMRNSAGTAAGRTIWYDYAMIRCKYRNPK